MFLVDDVLFAPFNGVMWLCKQLQEVVEKEMTNEEPVYQAILENELAFEEGRIPRAAYDERQDILMAQLREIKERKKGLSKAPPAGPISGAASLEIDVDFGYGKRGEDR